MMKSYCVRGKYDDGGDVCKRGVRLIVMMMMCNYKRCHSVTIMSRDDRTEVSNYDDDDDDDDII